MKNQTLNFKTAREFKKYLNTLKVLPKELNRKVDFSNFIKIKNSVLLFGLQREINVIETSVFTHGINSHYILDGQHLVKAILDLDDAQIEGSMSVRINYFSDEKEIIKLASTLNEVGKKWVLDDYLNSWANTGDEDYRKLMEIQKECKVSLNPLIELFYGTDSGNVIFKRGDFEFKQPKAMEMLDFWYEVKDYFYNNKALLGALARLQNRVGFSLKECRQKIYQNSEALKLPIGRDEIIKILK